MPLPDRRRLLYGPYDPPPLPGDSAYCPVRDCEVIIELDGRSHFLAPLQGAGPQRPELAGLPDEVHTSARPQSAGLGRSRDLRWGDF